MNRIAQDQNPDGSWGADAPQSLRLSVVVWNLLALKAAATAGLPTDPAGLTRGAAWVRSTVATIEGPPVGNAADSIALSRARASRAVARALTGGPTEDLAGDVDWVVRELDEGSGSLRDAETILFSMLMLSTQSGDRLDSPKRQLGAIVVRSMIGDQCAEGSWIFPSSGGTRAAAW